MKVQSIVDPGVILIYLIRERRKNMMKSSEMINQMKSKVDVIVLSRYSMAHVKDQVTCSVPILTAPNAAAKRCYMYLQSQNV